MSSAVVIAYGDSLIAGSGTNFASAPDPDRAIFGNPSDRIQVYGRWADPDLDVRLGNSPYVGPDWVPYSPETGNWEQAGTSPVYSFLEKAARFYGLDRIYLILFGVPGSDATPLHPNPAGSWHPSSALGLMPRFKTHYLTPAFATPELTGVPQVLALFTALGQNCGHNSFSSKAVTSLLADIRATTTEIAKFIQAKTHPSVVLLQNPMLPRAAPSGFVPLQVWESRSLQKIWLQSPTAYGRALVNIDDVPLQSDGIHPTHIGAIEVGSRAFFGLLGASPSFSLIDHD